MDAVYCMMNEGGKNEFKNYDGAKGGACYWDRDEGRPLDQTLIVVI